MIHSFPWIMESISWQLAQNDFRPFSFTPGCAASPSAKRSGRFTRWYEGCTILENQHMVPMPRASSAGSVGMSLDRKSTRLNSSHLVISYAVFCLKKKKRKHKRYTSATNERNKDHNA